MQFWQNVLVLLERQNRSVRSLGRAIGVSSTSLSKYGKGAVPSLKIAMKIADELEVSLDWLAYGTLDSQPRTVCSAPDEHKLLAELLDEFGMRDILKLSRLSSKGVAGEIYDVLRQKHPRPVTRTAIERTLNTHSSDVIEASLILLRRSSYIAEKERDGQLSYSVAAPVGMFRQQEPSLPI